jgi:hypothetical protein
MSSRCPIDVFLRNHAPSIRGHLPIPSTGRIVECVSALVLEDVLDRIVVDRLRNRMPVNVVAPATGLANRHGSDESRVAPSFAPDPLHRRAVPRATQRVEKAHRSVDSIDEDSRCVVDGAQYGPLAHAWGSKRPVNDISWYVGIIWLWNQARSALEVATYSEREDRERSRPETSNRISRRVWLRPHGVRTQDEYGGNNLGSHSAPLASRRGTRADRLCRSRVARASAAGKPG